MVVIFLSLQYSSSSCCKSCLLTCTLTSSLKQTLRRDVIWRDQNHGLAGHIEYFVDTLDEYPTGTEVRSQPKLFGDFIVYRRKESSFRGYQKSPAFIVKKSIYPRSKLPVSARYGVTFGTNAPKTSMNALREVVIVSIFQPLGEIERPPLVKMCLQQLIGNLNPKLMMSTDRRRFYRGR